METHLCADCGTEDVFCPACAALGPVRGCTAVFRAAEAAPLLQMVTLAVAEWAMSGVAEGRAESA
ncbi:hypothetical protein AB1399_00080 [Hydrogenibacillus schlegelii]|uniref:hypothetical protein n=1 Tax=Hydrogenibacillus schlegelii TaxID=1484 RepID=UPI0034A004C2